MEIRVLGRELLFDARIVAPIAAKVAPRPRDELVVAGASGRELLVD
jgi:hypothetical protein